MSVLLISDLHLSEERPDITEAFLFFLKHRTDHCERLYILGDFFDVWVGDDGMGVFEHRIANELKKLAEKGITIYLMHGNRDFAIGSTFCRLANCTLLKDPTLADFYGISVLLSHGDFLCTQDIAYQRMRRLYRNSFVLFLLKRLPLVVRRYIGRKLRAKSRINKKNKAASIMDVTPQAVVELLEKYKVQLLVHGHTHRPAIHELMANQKPAKRIVLGDWEPNGTILKVTPEHFGLEKVY